MQEEVTNKTIALVFRTTKLTAETLKKAIQMYLEYQKGKTQNNHGKISVKKLVGQNAGVSSIEVTDNNIKQFEKVAKKYSVDFSIKKMGATNGSLPTVWMPSLNALLFIG